MWKRDTDPEPMCWLRAPLITILLALISIVKHNRAAAAAAAAAILHLRVWIVTRCQLKNEYHLHAVNIAPQSTHSRTHIAYSVLFASQLARHPIVLAVAKSEERTKKIKRFFRLMKSEAGDAAAAACVVPTPSTTSAHLTRRTFFFSSSHSGWLPFNTHFQLSGMRCEKALTNKTNNAGEGGEGGEGRRVSGTRTECAAEKWNWFRSREDCCWKLIKCMKCMYIVKTTDSV